MATSVPAPMLLEPTLTVLTTAELAQRWRCTPRTLERMARDGRIRRVKLRGGVRYPLDEVLRIERGEAASEGKTASIARERAPAPMVRGGAAGTPPDGPPSETTAVSVPAVPSVARTAETAATGTAATGTAVLPEDMRPSLPPVAERSWYTVCVAHRKGGVAKSTTTWYLARELARAGKRVILRDLDPQQGLRDILRDHGCEDGRYSRSIALVPDGAELPFHPDVELIDTPPALDDSLPGVARADGVIVPAMPEHQAVRALERMLLVLHDTRHEHPFTTVLGILPVRVKPRWSEHAAFLRQIALLGERFNHPLLPAIPESRAVLTYSLRGRLWRPVAEVVLERMARERSAGDGAGPDWPVSANGTGTSASSRGG
ncbi:MAG: AAA family ATPase [Chloroflexi bacterium]|nr:AAA family ATPase [Chloroflexota bacterium]